MHVGVFGAGYVGLVTGTCFAEMGNDVVIRDVDEERIAGLRRGRIPIYEPGLEEMLQRNLEMGRLRFTTRRARCRELRGGHLRRRGHARRRGRIGGPVARAGGRAEIAQHAAGPRIVVNKSTVPVGTGRKVSEALAESAPHEFLVVSNPEFLKEGAAVEDFMKPDRVVVGGDSDKAREVMRRALRPVRPHRQPHPASWTSNRPS